MIRFIPADQFLCGINQYVVVREIDGRDEILQRPEGEAGPNGSGQLLLDLEPERRFVWGNEIDSVLEGPCSEDPYPGVHNGVRLDRDQYPMGACIRDANDPEDTPLRSWLHTVLASDNMKGVSRVLVYAECCGWYSEEYINRIRRLFPKITWTFGEVPDLCDCTHMQPVKVKLAEALVRQGVLRIE